MNSDPLSIVGMVLLLILSTLVVLAVIAFFLNRYWQSKIAEDLKIASALLRQSGAEGKALRVGVQDFSENPPLPFGPLVRLLRSQLDASDRLAQSYTVQYGDYQHSLRQINQKAWKAILFRPFRSYRLQKQVTGLAADLTKESQALQSSREILELIENQGWLLAGKVRQAKQKLDKICQTRSDLQLRGIRGDIFYASVQEEKYVNEAISAIQSFYLEDARESVLAQATQESIIAGFRIVSDHQDAVDRLLEQTETWNKQFSAAEDDLKVLKQTIQVFRIALTEILPGLILSEVGDLYSNLAATVNEIDERMAAPRIDDLLDLSQVITGASQDAKEAVENLDNTSRQYADLSHSIPEIETLRQELITKHARLSTNSIYPLVWNKSQVQLNDLNLRLESLGKIDKPRSPAQLEKDSSLARTLSGRLKELDSQYQTASTQYHAVIQILTSLDLPGILARSQVSHRLADKLAEYNTENWPRQDGINVFRTDLESFLAELKIVIPENTSVSLKETELAHLLEQVKAVSNQLQMLRQREERINHRLLEIQSVESNSQERLATAKMLLSQIALVANSNKVLKEILGGELEHWQASNDQLAGDLGNRQQGLVMKKSQKVIELYDRIERGSNNWLSKFNSDVRVKKEIITDKISRLKAIADLSEPVIADAAKILQTENNQEEQNSAQPKKNRFGLAEIILQFKVANETWQRSVSITRAIEEIENVVYDANDKAEKNRETAQEQLQQASQWISGSKEWPPTSTNIDDEQKEFEEIELLRASTRKEQPRALWLVGRLSDIASRYQSLSEKARRKGERAEADQNRIRELEKKLDDAIRLWTYQRNAYSTNTMTTATIQRLVNDSSREMESIKRQYRQGFRTYSQVEQDLITLSQQTSKTTVPIQDDQKIDINGEIRVERNT